MYHIVKVVNHEPRVLSTRDALILNRVLVRAGYEQVFVKFAAGVSMSQYAKVAR